jgi:hypothetical protein
VSEEEREREGGKGKGGRKGKGREVSDAFLHAPAAPRRKERKGRELLEEGGNRRENAEKGKEREGARKGRMGKGGKEREQESKEVRERE